MRLACEHNCNILAVCVFFTIYGDNAAAVHVLRIEQETAKCEASSQNFVEMFTDLVHRESSVRRVSSRNIGKQLSDLKVLHR